MTSYRIQSPLKTAALMVSVTSILMSPAGAKNGPFPHGIGNQFGQGGAGTALATGSSDAFENPSVGTRIDTQLSAYFINYFQEQALDTSKNAPAGNPVGLQKNRLKNSPGGSFSGNYVLNSQWAVGFATSGGATNIKYDASTLNPGALNPANSTFNNELVNTAMLMSPTVSYRHTPCQSYGFSLILGYQTLKTNLAKSSPPPFSQTSGALRVDSATGIGARVGGLWDVNSHVSLGVSASTPVKFSKFKKYLDVLPLPFDVPAMFRLGMALHVGKTDYLFDIKEIFFSKVKSLGDSLGWKNQTVLMFGVHHRLTPCLIVTAGYNHGNSPVRSNNVFLNSLLIPIARHHFTAGARYHLTPNWEMSAGAEFTPNVQMVDNGTGILGAAGRGARIKNRDVGVLLGVTYHFSKPK